MATLKLIFGIAVFGMIALVGLKVIPPYFANYEFEDSIKTESVQATYTHAPKTTFVRLSSSRRAATILT